MHTIKLAVSGTSGHRTSLSDIVDHVKRAWTTRAARRALRPLQDVDSWSDQAEVAFYEDGYAARGF